MTSYGYRVQTRGAMVGVWLGRKCCVLTTVAEARRIAADITATADAIAPPPPSDLHPFEGDPVGACLLCGQRDAYPLHDPDWSKP